MTMKKKLLTTLSVVLILGLAALGILAYLTDTDSDVNVMTMGNVSIEQHEYQRATNADGTYKTDTIDKQTSYVLEKFDQDKALLPATEVDANGNPYNYGAGTWDTTTVRMSQVGSYGGMDVFESKNAQDKFVVVTNNGKTDAYVRTLVAIEVGSADADLIGTSYHNNWSKNKIGKVTIDGNDYNVFEYVYKGASDNSRHVNGILPAGDTAYPNLSQVYLQAKATNEDMEAIDGNNNGKLDILVLSQAVQADGFDNAQTALETAFPKGDNNANVVEWFAAVLDAQVTEVENAEELANAIEAGEDVVLTANIEINENISVASGEEVEIDLNGNDLTLNTVDEDDLGIQATGEDAIVNIVNSNEDVNVELKLNGVTTLAATDGGTINVENVNIVADINSTNILDRINATGGIFALGTNSGDLNLKNTTIDMGYGCIYVANDSSDVETGLTMENVTLKTTNPQYAVFAVANNNDKPLVWINITNSSVQLPSEANGIRARATQNNSIIIKKVNSDTFTVYDEQSGGTVTVN